MMNDLFLPIIAFVVYITGGLLTFAGIVMILLLRGKNLWGWGDAYGIGFLSVFIGLVLCILGVLILRIVRNRDLRNFEDS